MIIAIRSGLVCVDIPVHYRKRVGTSKITGQFWKAFRLGLLMTAMIIRCRFQILPPGGFSGGSGSIEPRDHGTDYNDEESVSSAVQASYPSDGAPSDRGQQHGTGTAFVERATTAGASINEAVL